MLMNSYYPKKLFHVFWRLLFQKFSSQREVSYLTIVFLFSW